MHPRIGLYVGESAIFGTGRVTRVDDNELHVVNGPVEVICEFKATRKSKPHWRIRLRYPVALTDMVQLTAALRLAEEVLTVGIPR